MPTFVVNGDDSRLGKQTACYAGRGVTIGNAVRPESARGRGRQDLYVRGLREAAGIACSRPSRDRAAGPPLGPRRQGRETQLPADKWTELHVTFTVEKPFPEGWFAYLAGGEDGARLRVDGFRISEGSYTPAEGESPGSRQTATSAAIDFKNPSFETGKEGWSFTCDEQYNLRRTYRRASFTLARLLGNMGVAAPTPLLKRFHEPVTDAQSEKRWLAGFYLDQPEEWDDPYRFFNW